MKAALLLLTALSLGSCSCHDKVSPEITRLKAQLAKMEASYLELGDRVRVSDGDPGLKAQLVNERELLKSRIERLKEILHRLDPDADLSSPAAKAPSASH